MRDRINMHYYAYHTYLTLSRFKLADSRLLNGFIVASFLDKLGVK